LGYISPTYKGNDFGYAPGSETIDGGESRTGRVGTTRVQEKLFFRADSVEWTGLYFDLGF
jgi:hypothetical protein